jgi:hypothetical protein
MLAVVVGAIAFSCGSAKPTNTVTVQIGAAFPRTGASATPEWGDAMSLAVAHANSALSKQPYKGLQFQLIQNDSLGQPAASVAAAQALVKAGVKALITDTSPDHNAVNLTYYDADTGNDLNVPLLTVGGTSPSINDPEAISNFADGGTNAPAQSGLRNEKGWSFRMAMSSIPQAKVLAQILYAKGTKGDTNGDGKFKIAIYAIDDSFGNPFSNGIRDAARALNPNAKIEQMFHATTVAVATYNWAADVAKLCDDHNENTNETDGVPDAIIEVTQPTFTVAVVNAYKTGQYTVPFLHTHSFRAASIVQSLGDKVNDHEGTSPVVSEDNASGTLFDTELKKATGSGPSGFTAHAYDAVFAVELATVLASKSLDDPSQVTGEQVRDALKKINDTAGTKVFAGPDEFAKASKLIADGKAINYEGASSTLDWDATNRVINNISHFVVKAQQFVDLEKYDCVSSADCLKKQ